jgi:hypothetical protein
MALDTQEKRMNVVGVGRPWLRTKLPGAKDQAWRVASGNAYGGNEIAAPVEPDEPANPSPRVARLLQPMFVQQSRRHRRPGGVLRVRTFVVVAMSDRQQTGSEVMSGTRRPGPQVMMNSSRVGVEAIR